MTKAKWNELRHAYGPANDIPPLLEALEGSKAKERSAALDELEEKLYHQGHRFDATMAALPTLLGTLGDATRKDRVRMVTFLSHIAVQYPDVVIYEKKWGDLKKDGLFVAMRDALGTVTSLLSDRDVALRAAALGLLANIPPGDPSPLRQALDDKSDLVRGLAVLALARWGLFTGNSASVQVEVEQRATAGKGKERVLAAAAAFQLKPSQAAADRVLDLLPSASTDVRQFPFEDGNLFTFLAGVLTSESPKYTDNGARLLEHLREPLKRKSDGSFELVVGSIHAFFGKVLDSRSPVAAWTNKAPEDLSALQLEFLRLLAVSGPASTHTDLLSARGLPLHGENIEPKELKRVLKTYLGQLAEEGLMIRLASPSGKNAETWPLYKWMRAIQLDVVEEAAFEKVLLKLKANRFCDVLMCLSSPGPNLVTVPQYDLRRFVDVGFRALQARKSEASLARGVQERIEQRVKHDPEGLFGAVLYLWHLLRERKQGLPPKFDAPLPRVLHRADTAWIREPAIEIVSDLPAKRRDAVIERCDMEMCSKLFDVPRVDGWTFLNLHSDRQRSIERAIREIRSWNEPSEIHSRFRTKVQEVLASLGPDVVPAAEKALSGKKGKPGDVLLKKFLKKLKT